MNKIAYFLDHDTASPTAWEVWGPVPQSGGPQNAMFQTTEICTFALPPNRAKAYGVCPGQLVIVPQYNTSGTRVQGKVNGILIPFSGQVSSSLPKIRYFIYRGLDESTFYSGTTQFIPATSTDPNATELNLRIKNDRTDYVQANPNTSQLDWDYGYKLVHSANGDLKDTEELDELLNELESANYYYQQ